MLTTDLPQENQTPTTLSILNTTIYRSNIIQVPRFLIFGVNANRRLTCKQMFEHVVPKIKASNITDKNLTELLFGTNSSSWYISYSDTNESIPMTQGKFCSNISNEWISLIVHQEEQATIKNKRVMKILSDTSKNEHECTPFNLNRNPLSKFSKGYPKLFEFQHQQIIKESSLYRPNVSIEISHLVLHYIRRKAVDYIKYQDKSARTTVAPINMVMTINSITSKEIYLKFEAKKKDIVQTHLKCSAFLQEKRFNRTQTFQMSHPAIVFNRLIPLTRYNICASCEGMVNKVCRQITTLDVAKGSLDIKSENLSRTNRSERSVTSSLSSSSGVITSIVISISAVILAAIGIVLMLYIVVPSRVAHLCGQCRAFNFHRRATNPVVIQRQDRSDDESSLTESSGSNTTIGIQPTDFIWHWFSRRYSSLSTLIGRSARDLRSSESSINSELLPI